MPEQEQKILEKVSKNWELYTSLVEKKVQDKDVREPLLSMCEELHERLSTCPASTRADYVGAFPGGLVAHSLNVLKVMNELNKAYKISLSSDNLIITALFHDIGKIGTLDHDYYLRQESEWHRKRGMLYEINPELPNVPVAVRSLYWLNSSGVPMSEHEIHAICSLQHLGQMYLSELYNVPPLTLLLQQAVRAAIVLNKENMSILSQ